MMLPILLGLLLAVGATNDLDETQHDDQDRSDRYSQQLEGVDDPVHPPAQHPRGYLAELQFSFSRICCSLTRLASIAAAAPSSRFVLPLPNPEAASFPETGKSAAGGGWTPEKTAENNVQGLPFL